MHEYRQTPAETNRSPKAFDTGNSGFASRTCALCFRQGRVLCAFLLLFLCGCQYPLGLSKKEWQALPLAQQAEYRAKQTVIDEERRKEWLARQEQQRNEQLERQRLEQERIETAYATAKFGDVVTITIHGGMIKFFGRRQAFEPISFDLIRGEARLVEFVQRNNSTLRTEIPVRLSEDGNTLFFDCDSVRRIAIVNDGWETGRLYHPEELPEHSSWSGASGLIMRLQFKELPGSSARLIIQHPPADYRRK
jgi:hypothetical protein